MKRVAMFVTNPCTHDARVMKEAKSLVDVGYEVRVFALANAHYPEGVFEQSGYTVHRIKFENIFSRVQKILWGTTNFLFAPFRLLKMAIKLTVAFIRDSTSFVIAGILMIQSLIASIVFGLLALCLMPIFPKIGSFLRTLANRYSGKSQVIKTSQPPSVIKLNVVQRLAKRVRYYKVVTYLVLKDTFSFPVRKKLQPICRIGFGVLFLSFKFAWLFCRKIIPLYRTVRRAVRRVLRIAYSKTYSFLVRTRRSVVAKINRGVYVVLLPIHKTTTYLFFCRNAAAKAIIWKPDVAHAHDLNTMYAAKMVKDALNSKVVYDSHELWVHRNRVGRKAVLEKIIDRRVEKYLIPFADEIVTVCDSIGNWLKDHYIGIPEPIIVRNMPHKMDNRELVKGIDPLGKRLNVPAGHVTMIYTGKITSGRGIEIGVEALTQIDTLHFVLLGYGEQSYIGALEAKINELNVADRVIFCDPVPHTEVTNFIYGADFALVYIEPICLSYEYALPNKLFESIQAGIPIMGSKLVEIQNLVEGKNLGLCFSSATDLAEKVEQGLDEVTLERWRASIKASQGELCWDVEQTKLTNMYQRLAA